MRASDDGKAVAIADLSRLGMFEFLDADSRPTFVLDTLSPAGAASLEPVFQNKALLSDHHVFSNVHGRRSGTDTAVSWHYTYQDFLHWAVDGQSNESQTSTYAFQGYIWNRFAFQKRFIVLSGTIFSNFAGRIVPGRSTSGELISEGRWRTSTSSRQNSLDTSSMRSPNSELQIRKSRFDWTRMDVEGLDGHLRYARSVDWASTPLGPIEFWSQDFRTIANMCFADSEPVLLYWGAERIVLYNAAYVDLIAANHPCMGKPAIQAFPEYADFMATIFDRTGQTGETFAVDDLPIFLTTPEGHKQEEYICLKMIPLLNADDEIVGVYQRGTYSTARICHERRLETLKSLTVQTANARNFGDFWHLVTTALRDNDKDIMFAMVYTNNEMCSPVSSTRQWLDNEDLCCQLVLRGHLGIASDHPAAVASFSSKNTSSGFMPWFRRAGASEKHVILRADDKSLPEGFLNGISSQDYDDICQAVVISPLRYADSTPIVGFLVVGSSPRTKVNSMYVEFQQALATTIGTYMGSLARFGEVLAQHDASMAEATAEQAKLFEELKETRLQAIQTEKMLRHFVETSQVGVFVMDKNARYVYRNQGWSDLTNESLDSTIHQAWDKIADPEFTDYLQEEWALLLSEKQPRRYEFKTLKVWEPNGEVCRSADHEKEHRVWLLISAFPDVAPDGEVTQVLGSVTDISALKWANKVHQGEAIEAIESKRRLESFIDTTNHELRNPLSAIILASDDIMATVDEALQSTAHGNLSKDKVSSLLHSLLENARTISACAKHQKRIVDDVLTASKLDAMLLQITPSARDPRQEIADCIQIFKADAMLAKVQVSFDVSARYRALQKQSFVLDATRFMQIFMNLLTNAMKFTKYESIRLVHVSLDVSYHHPNTEGFTRFIPPVNDLEDPTVGVDWGRGAQVYLLVHVQDSGKGLTPDEADNLFNRFSQASPKTHVRYGGSGLGLFISRRLAELQGGGIGLKSEAGVGSTFSFFIKCRLAPDSTSQDQSSGTFHDLKIDPLQATLMHEHSSPSNSLDVRQMPRSSSPTARSRSDATSMMETPRAACLWRADMLHVLVVEDNLVNQKMLAKQLRRVGCTVLLANHGAEALDHIQQSRWAYQAHREITIVLMDWEMPVLDGLASTRILRRREREGSLRGHIPVLGVTANVRKEQIDQALEAGMDDIVCKPFRIPDLLDKIFRTLERLDSPQTGHISNDDITMRD